MKNIMPAKWALAGLPQRGSLLSPLHGSD